MQGADSRKAALLSCAKHANRILQQYFNKSNCSSTIALCEKVQTLFGRVLVPALICGANPNSFLKIRGWDREERISPQNRKLREDPKFCVMLCSTGNCLAASSSMTDQDMAVWSQTQDMGSPYSAFSTSLSESPDLCLSRFGEQDSVCRDLLTLGNNAVRNELSDMFVMYRAMVDIGESLSHRDVKKSTLWFRGFYKFTLQNVLCWQREVLFPWFQGALKIDTEHGGRMNSLYRHCYQAEESLRTVYAKQARLSSELARDARQDVVRVQFTDAVGGAVNLAVELIEYFKTAENFLVPLLSGSGLNHTDRDAMFKKLCLFIQEAGTEQIDVPMLITWMPRSALREWLMTCAVDHKNKPIPMWMYNGWQNDHYHKRHRVLVEDVAAKAKRA